MGILNITPDSFYDGNKNSDSKAIVKSAGQMLQQGATFLDIGGVSTKPGAVEVSEEEELKRVIPVLELLKKEFPQALFSVDTFRSRVARAAYDVGASIINDISAGKFDDNLMKTVGELGLPYILMHMQGSPATMQLKPQYDDVTQEVFDFFTKKINHLVALGVKDIILDPGFGFGKTVAHNYQLLKQLHVFKIHDFPIMAGISRKSMICKVLKVNPVDALNGTTALHIVALQQGAKILRVHDVKEAVQVIRLWRELDKVSNEGISESTDRR